MPDVTSKSALKVLPVSSREGYQPRDQPSLSRKGLTDHVGKCQRGTESDAEALNRHGCETGSSHRRLDVPVQMASGHEPLPHRVETGLKGPPGTSPWRTTCS